MAPHDEEDDPAVYRSARSARSKKPAEGPSANGRAHTNGDGDGVADSDTQMHEDGPAEDSEDGDEDGDEDEDGGTLLTVQPGFNRLLLVLRDEGVMRFVKYVSAAAEGSRWDVCGEFEVGMVEEDED